VGDETGEVSNQKEKANAKRKKKKNHISRWARGDDEKLGSGDKLHRKDQKDPQAFEVEGKDGATVGRVHKRDAHRVREERCGTSTGHGG